MSSTTRMQSIILILLSICSYGASSADPLISAGNGILRPKTLETLIRGTIADTLNGQLSNSSLRFNLPAIDESVVLPAPTGNLKDILDILGIKDNLAIGISPIQTKFTLPSGGLSLDIKNRAANSFLITAKWSLSALSAKTETLAIKVPAGMFDRPFEIHSSPLQIALKTGSKPIQFSLVLQADLTSEGTKVKLQSFTTNLNADSHPDFSIQLGQLTVEGQPLSLQIQSNGQTLTADEASIRAEFQTLESTYADAIRQKLSDLIETQGAATAHTLEVQKPFKFQANSDEFLADLNMNSDTRHLLGGIDMSFLLSYLQAVRSMNVYSAQISSKICFDGQCLGNLGPVSPVGANDLRAMKSSEDLGVVVYESMLQSVIHSEAFQKRIATYYKNAAASPGVTLSGRGVKVYLDPTKDAILAVVNLEIDIKSTTASSTWTAIENSLADWWEAHNGSGSLVKIPVAVNFKLAGLSEGNFIINTELISFASDGTYTPPPRCSATDCPNNIGQMHPLVRKGLLASVKEQIGKAIPAQIKIPMSSAIKLKNFSFQPKNLVVTPNHGLMVTASMKAFSPGAARP
jgi:hypothetical protein